MFSFFPLSVSFLFLLFLDKRNEFGVGLEILQTLSKLILFSYLFYFSLEKRNEFGVTLEILQILSKRTPNSLQTQRISFFLSYFFLEKRNEFGASLESLQTLSKLSPNRLQTHVSFGNVTTEKTASPGSPAKLS